jgi:anti-sigma regulatory factor (Ser/Thr protein kinase)
VGALTRVPLIADARWIRAEGPAAIGAVRRAAVELAGRLGLGPERQGELAILATELTTNLHKHAREGSVLLRSLRHGTDAGVQLVAVDAGPGMADIVASARDGHSTAGTLGIGLSAIGRQSTWSDIYSVPGAGTVCAAEVWSRRQRTGAWADGVTRPMTGEAGCGDLFAVRGLGDRGQLLMCDGLGHGPLAEAAGQAAVRAFHEAPEDSPAAVVEHLHQALRATRGAAVMVSEVESTASVVRTAGLGNIAGFVVAPGLRRQMVTLPGIAGHQRSRVREFSYDLPASAVIVMHSDGLTDRWRLDDQPALLAHSPTVIAATLLRMAGVRRDDAGVLVARVPETAAGAAPPAGA